jgi:hypothetical protein
MAVLWLADARAVREREREWPVGGWGRREAAAVQVVQAQTVAG